MLARGPGQKRRAQAGTILFLDRLHQQAAAVVVATQRAMVLVVVLAAAQVATELLEAEIRLLPLRRKVITVV